MSACRWHIRDPIPFTKSLTVAFERSGWARRGDDWKVVGDRNDAWSSVAFWYQAEPHGPLSVLGPPSERLPFTEVRIEPEEDDVFRELKVPEGVPAPVVQTGSFWAYGAQVSYAPKTRDDARLTLPFDVPAPRDYDLLVRCTKSLDEGVWQLLLDGEPLGAPLDLYSPRTVLREQLLGRRFLKPGGHELEFRGTGKNLESQGFSLGLDSFIARWLP